ncbi:MAG: GIY-YIG nuclease family protein [Oscillospiraceae bacterium]|nr:GIY-YIG nuclease family protein [Oscillospiraceae bacterium]
MNYTYILECADGTLYTGWTNDIRKRLASHNAGKGGKYTRSRLPVRLVYAEEHEERKDAMRREVLIKQLSRQEKLKLLESELNRAETVIQDT